MYKPTFDLNEIISSFGGSLIHEPTLKNPKYQYAALFPYSEDFGSKVVEGLEDFIARHTIDYINKDSIVLHFDIYD